MIVATLSGLIIIIIIVLLLLVIFVKFMVSSIGIMFKKNCFECEYYRLHNVAGCGDRCWYMCDRFQREDSHSMNDRYYYCKCNEFKKKEIKKNDI